MMTLMLQIKFAVHIQKFTNWRDDMDLQTTAFTVHNLWILIATSMVFLMHLGFSMLEAGLTQGKNTVNILFKNLMIVAIGLVTYSVIGFNLVA